MKDIKMGPKLIGSYLLIVVLAVLLGIYLLAQLSEEKEDMDSLYNEGILSLNNMALSARTVNFMRITAYQAMLSDTRNDRYKKMREADSLNGVVHKIYEEEIKKTSNADDIKNINNVVRCLDEYKAIYQKYIETMDKGLSGEALLNELEKKAT